MISFVLEWENAILSELDRTRELLVQIFLQTAKRPEQFELLVLYNENQVSGSFISTFIEEVITTESLESYFPYTIHDVQNAHYFQLKNKGAQLAQGEKVIFLDSDIIPQESWLELILEAHQQHPDSIVSGCSYIDHSDLLGKAFALSWFFPLPPVASKLVEVDLIFSNNYIISKQLMLENPYPEMSMGVTRGADNLLWKRLRSKGIRLWCHSGARATHPSPNGWNHFFKRALAEGRDDYRKMFEKEFFEKNPFIQFSKIYLHRWRKVFRSAFRNGYRVGLKFYEIPLICGLMTVYYQFYFLGGLVTKVLPKYSQEAWRI